MRSHIASEVSRERGAASAVHSNSPLAPQASPLAQRPPIVRVTFATKLVLSFLLIIVLTSALLSVVGVQIIGHRVVQEAQERVRTDLNSAREIYLSRLAHIKDVVQFTADRVLLMNTLFSGDLKQASEALGKTRNRENLDVLTVTDRTGKVILRSRPDSPGLGDDRSQDSLVRLALENRETVAATARVSADALREESPQLMEQARFKFIPTPMARTRPEQEETAGLMLMAAAPIFDAGTNFLGVVYGGVLLNRNFDIVDKIKQTVFQGLKYNGEDIGTSTLFQDDLRIATNVRSADGARAVGTRVAEEVYRRVVQEGAQWVGRAYVVNNWYITAYEPLRDIRSQIVGILYVGILEQKYRDIKRRTIFTFLAILLAGALVTMGLGYLVSRSVSVSVNKLASASHAIAHGDLDATVTIHSKDELQELAETFNFMASSLKKRDEKLREFARTRIMESERLALIGQLAAGVAHEINNPLQGIVTYSHLLLEKLPEGNGANDLVQRIVTQANRCRDTIRGLLDFSRQRKPAKRPASVNAVLEECVALVENQALFHNIQIVKQLNVDLPPVVLDPSQIQQVFMNMIINAAEAMSGSGRLTLTTRIVPAEKVVEVEFADTGHGIKSGDLERIFDPFFTTKEVGHGTGLGLAISYGIVKEHEGAIAVESEVNQGTTFTVRLPLTAEGGASA